MLILGANFATAGQFHVDANQVGTEVLTDTPKWDSICWEETFSQFLQKTKEVVFNSGAKRHFSWEDLKMEIERVLSLIYDRDKVINEECLFKYTKFYAASANIGSKTIVAITITRGFDKFRAEYKPKSPKFKGTGFFATQFDIKQSY